jgi:predicted nucleic acid-binding protein
LSFVLDASLALAWVFDDEGSPPLDILARVRSDGAFVPGHWRLEVANALRIAVRRRRFTDEFAAASLVDLNGLRITVDPETDRHAWGRTRQMSDEYDLTVYDAAYLELALRLALPLASYDRNLNRAAKRARVEVLAG